MNKTAWFFWKRKAEAFAESLRQRGVYAPVVEAHRTWGPRDCFHVPFSGWDVEWFESK